MTRMRTKGKVTLLYERGDSSDLDDEGGMRVMLWRCDLGKRTIYNLFCTYEVAACEEPDSAAYFSEVEAYNARGLADGDNDAEMIHEAVKAYDETWQRWQERLQHHLHLRSVRERNGKTPAQIAREVVGAIDTWQAQGGQTEAQR